MSSASLRPACALSEVAVSVLEHEQLMVALWLHSAVDPPAAEWDAVVAKLVEARRARNVPVDRLRQLVLSDGGAPNALQRNRAIRQLQDNLPCALAVVTGVLSNPLKRGVATAMTWLNPAVRFYEPSGFLSALDYLELRAGRHAVWREAQKLASQVKPQRVLPLIEATALHRRPSRPPSLAP